MQSTASNDETEYDVDGVYTAKELAEDIVRIIDRQATKTRSFTALSAAILEHLRYCDLAK